MSGRVDAVYSPAVTIAAGAAESDAAAIATLGVRGLSLRGNWEDWTTAQIVPQVSFDEGTPTTWQNLWKLNSAGDALEVVACLNPAAVSVPNGDVIEVPVQAWMVGNARWLRIASRNTSNYATAVNQVTQIDIVVGTLA